MIATLIAAATLVIFVAVVHRYGSACRSSTRSCYHIHLSWAQELCIYMFVWMAKFGAAYGVRTGIHVGVDVLVNMLQPGMAQRSILFGLLCGALFTVVVGTMGAKFVIELYPTDQISPDLEIPSWIVYPGHPARLLPDVLPLPAGRVGVLAHRRIAASRSGPCRGRGREARPRPRDLAAEERAPMNSALIFGLLIALMLTGMPISIALGLTVLTLPVLP